MADINQDYTAYMADLIKSELNKIVKKHNPTWSIEYGTYNYIDGYQIVLDYYNGSNEHLRYLFSYYSESSNIIVELGNDSHLNMFHNQDTINLNKQVLNAIKVFDNNEGFRIIAKYYATITTDDDNKNVDRYC